MGSGDLERKEEKHRWRTSGAVTGRGRGLRHARLQAFPSPGSGQGTSPQTLLVCLALSDGGSVCSLHPGLSPRGSWHWLKLWEQESETEAFRRLPDLNQSHGHETESPIENSIIAKCLGIYIYLCLRVSSLLKRKKTTHLAKMGKKEVLLNKYSGWLFRTLEIMNRVKKKCPWQVVNRLYLGRVQIRGPRQASSHSPGVFLCLFITTHTFTHQKCGGH